MEQQIPKRRMLEQFAVIAKAVGHEYRLELLELVAQRERSVEALTQLTQLPVGSVSQHLQQLRRAGLVTARKEGKYVYYALADEEVLTLMSTLRRVAERNIAEVNQLIAQYFEDHQDLDTLSSAELLERLQRNEVTLIDVRPPEEYASGHLPGAINVPLDELEARLQDLPAEQQVVAYCRGPFCALARDAVRRLRRQGVDATRLNQGFPEWKAEGLPVQ
ncbi:ArsR/SmtB family transcription factor [Halorhodospira halophila]|uniref:ArsR/SmtB family transcription factor n=1 Tax=Halorhodospira halophila TaxID=1053 RepID=UPI001913C5E0|nr:metalloregulator ArsR/SmtB family transcription factor [Halorhodospira halophila]MBK5936182.1 ArsR family transcriptional regulator [Halorhodospira halophila]